MQSADDFANLFADKVNDVRASTSATPLHDVPLTASYTLRGWNPVLPGDVEMLIGSALKTCQLDPVPTWLVKECAGLLSPCTTLLINTSISTGCFPAKYKHAVDIPLLIDSLDVSQLKNYRPVSNSPFISKLLERNVHTQLLNYLAEHDYTT